MSDEHVDEAEGGDSACFAHLICPECGVVLDGTAHVEGCTWTDTEHVVEPGPAVNPTPED